MKTIKLSNDLNHLEDGIINDHIPVNQAAQYSDIDVEFVDPVRVQIAEDQRQKRKTMMDKAAHIIRTSPSNRGKKYMCMMLLKKSYPDISLKEFCELYCKSLNQDTIEDTENNGIANQVEHDYLFGKGRQRRALRKKGVSRKQARRTVRKKKIIRKKVGKAARKVGATAKRVGKTIKRTATAAALTPLLPFKGLMIKELNKKGKPYSKRSKLIDIATAYYKYIVKGNHFEDLPDDWYEKDLMYFEPPETFSEDHIAAATITTIVTAIVTFIKSSKNKKEKGLPMTDAEVVAADEAEKFVKKVEAKTGKDLSQPSPITEAAKSQVMSEYKAEAADTTQKMIMIGAAVLLLIIIFK